MKNYKYCIFIAKFSPFHNGHKILLEEALNIADNVIIVIGSASGPRTIKNPWTVDERHSMIESSIDSNKNISFIHMKDYLYNENIWTLTLQQKINEITNYDNNIALISFKGDESIYLKSFPQYTSIKFEIDDKHHAAHIRERFFTYDLSYSYYLPKSVNDFLNQFSKTNHFISLKEEFDFIRKYKLAWDGAPFPPTFVTVDNIVLKSGHILLVKRKFNPGKGLFALPGGFLNQKEKIQDAALRELKEETKISTHFSELKKSIVNYQVYDDPDRSSRGRVITHAFLIDLGAGELPKIKGSDDAESAQWMPLNEVFLNEDKFFDDHFHIICHAVNQF